MRTYLDCVPCFVRQAVEAARMVSDDPEMHERVVRRVMQEALETPFSLPPPVIGRAIHRIIRAESDGAEDNPRGFDRRRRGAGDGGGRWH